MVLAVQDGNFARCFLPVFRVSTIVGEKKVAFDAAGFEPAEQGRDNAGVVMQTFTERPFFKL